MKKFKQMFVGLVCAMLLVTSAFAANTSVTATNGTPVVVQTVKAPATANALFNANEYGISVATAYTVDRANAFKQAYSQNLSVGAFYFPSKYVGFEANVPLYQSSGVSVNEVQAGALLRVPLSQNTPVLKNVALYGGLGGAYNWQEAQDWSYIAKAGAEVRVNSGWGLFAEAQYRNYQFQELNNGQTSLNGGIRFKF
jgi:hypothetical protein